MPDLVETRSARSWINIYGFWDDAAADENRVAFVRGLPGDMDRWSSGGTTPANVFHVDHNSPPG
jgi:hypothetical protein